MATFSAFLEESFEERLRHFEELLLRSFPSNVPYSYSR